MVKRNHVLFIVENNPIPNDVRVWAEAVAVREMGLEVTIISPKEKSQLPFEIIDGIKIFRHPNPIEASKKLGFVFEYINALIWETIFSLRVFISNRFWVIHGANPPDHLFLIALFFKFFGVRYIFDHHDIAPENYLAKFGRKDAFYYLLLLFEKLTFMTADVVVSTNESYKEIALKRGKKREKQIHVVRNGPDLSKIIFMPPNPLLKGRFDFLVVYIGVISAQEGIDHLLRSVDYIVHEKAIRNIKFIIVGKGTNLNQMIALSEKMGLAQYVVFTGYVPYEKFYEILNTADLFVNPEFKNRFTDKSTMIKIMDYMVFGKPIVQFDTKEGRVTAGDAAIYVKKNDEIEFAEAIIDLLKDSEKRKRMGRFGKKRIHQNLNWDIQKIKLKKAYDYLLSR